MAVATDDPQIGEGAVLFSNFGDLVVVSKKKKLLRRSSTLCRKNRANAWIRRDVSKLTASVYS